MYNNVAKCSQGKEEVNRIFGVLQRNLDKNKKDVFSDKLYSSNDPKRDQISARLSKHLQMKREDFESSKTIIFDIDNEAFSEMQSSFDNHDILQRLTEVFDKADDEKHKFNPKLSNY